MNNFNELEKILSCTGYQYKCKYPQSSDATISYIVVANNKINITQISFHRYIEENQI